jgi:hypothetical protein
MPSVGRGDAVTLPCIVLIGGPPYVGKSAVARCIASRYAYACVSTDDLAKAVGSTYCALGHADIDPMAGMDWRDYFAKTPVGVLLDHDAASRQRVWPAIDGVVRAHAVRGDPVVLEGYALWPEPVAAAGFAATGAVWLAGSGPLLESRIRSKPAFRRGAPDEEALIRNLVRRSSRHAEHMLASAARCGATVIRPVVGQSVGDVADLCVSALAIQPDSATGSAAGR